MQTYDYNLTFTNGAIMHVKARDAVHAICIAVGMLNRSAAEEALERGASEAPKKLSSRDLLTMRRLNAPPTEDEIKRAPDFRLYFGGRP